MTVQLARKRIWKTLSYLEKFEIFSSHVAAAADDPVFWNSKSYHSAVSIATRYGLEGPGIESRWCKIFRTLQTDPGVHPTSYTMGTGSFPGVRRPWHGVDHPHPSRVEVEGRVELYIYSPYGLSLPVLG
jgi:hypothetical protein